MKVQDVMKETVKCCGPDTDLARAIALMWETDCGVLPVIVDGGKAIGMITDRDITIALGTRNKPASDISVIDVMSAAAHTASPDDDIQDALKTMQKEQVRRLPVVNSDGALSGILCLNDIALQVVPSNGKKKTHLSYEDVVTTLKAICERRHPALEEQYRTAQT